MLDDAFDRLNIAATEMDLTDNRSMTQSRGGSIEVSGYGAQLWHGSAGVSNSSPNKRRKELSFFRKIKEVGATFLMYSAHNKYLQNDPTGSLAESWTVTVAEATIQKGSTLDISGVPDDFAFLEGDRLSYVIGGATDRHFLHEITADSIGGNGDGTRTLSLRPFVHAGVPAGLEVKLAKAACEVMAVPGSVVSPSEATGVRTGGSFDFIQVMK